MADLRWRFEDEPEQSTRLADASTAVEGNPWEPGESPEPPSAATWRRRAASGLLVGLALVGMGLAVRVSGNARLLARIEAEVVHAVHTEHEALASGDEAVWLAMQASQRDAPGRRRFRAGPVGPLPGITAPQGTPVVRVEPDVGAARERGGNLDAAWAESELAMVLPSVAAFAGSPGQAGRFTERARWIRGRDGGWRRVAPDATLWSRWPEETGEDLASLQGLRSDLSTQLARQRARAATLPDGPLPELRTPNLRLRFLPADALHAVDLAARLEPWLARRCELLLEGEVDQGCRRVEVTLSLDTPGAAYVVPGKGLRLASPSAGWAPADEAARAAYAEAVLRLILRGNPRHPRVLEIALLEQLLADLGVPGEGGDGLVGGPALEGEDDGVGSRLGTRADGAPGSLPPVPNAWAMWRHLRPAIDALGSAGSISPGQRAAAAAEGVSVERTWDFARYLHASTGYAATERLTRGLDRIGLPDLLDWMRPALGPAALPVAIGWRAAPPPWPGPPSLLRCGSDADPLLLRPGRRLPVDLRTVVCPPASIVADAALRPDGTAVAVACHAVRSGNRYTSIVLAPLRGEDAVAGEAMPGIVELVDETPVDCCLRWADDETLLWNVAGTTRGRQRVEWHGLQVRPAAGRDAVDAALPLAEWSIDEGHMWPPYGGWAPRGARVLLEGIEDERPWTAVYEVPTGSKHGSEPTAGAEPVEPLWRVDGSQARWSLDGERLAWMSVADEVAAAPGEEVPGLDAGPAVTAARITLRVAAAANGASSRAQRLDRLLERAGVRAVEVERGLVLAALAGWSEDGRLGIAVRAAAPTERDEHEGPPLWLLSWDPDGDVGVSGSLELRVARGAATDRTEALEASRNGLPLAMLLGEVVWPPLSDVLLWRWPRGRTGLDPRITGLDPRLAGFNSRAADPPDETLDRDDPGGSPTRRPATEDEAHAWHFGDDGLWRAVPPTTLGASPAGYWVVNADGLRLVDDDTGEPRWWLEGPACVPELRAPGQPAG